MGFNPKREARPSQTIQEEGHTRKSALVSIPNGKPGPLRLSQTYCEPSIDRSFNPKREARPSQTTGRKDRCREPESVSIPNGKPGPLRPPEKRIFPVPVTSFNPKREARPSQTQYIGVSTPVKNGFNPKREARPSQTGSSMRSQRHSGTVSIPNGKPGPLRPHRGCRMSLKA